MITLPTSAECRCLLPDGRLLTVTATRRPRGNRADVKCALGAAPALAERVQEVVRLARHTELRLDSRDQVVLSMDVVPPAGVRDWELAAVLADRLVRGQYHARLPLLYGQGWSDGWHLGHVDGQPQQVVERLRRHLAQLPAPAVVVLGGHGSATDADHYLYLSHLGGLTGHADPAAAVSSACAWFPLHSGGVNDSLSWVEVSVHPLLPAPHEVHQPDEEDAIAVPGLDMSAQLAVRQALAGARHFDGRGLGRWRTVVRFGQPRFQGSSYELALVMADRLARGREFVPLGRLVASGCSAAWHAGRVDPVDGRAPKTALILSQAGAGDRVLLPKAWQDDSMTPFSDALRAKGASLAWIDRIGIL